MVRNEWPSSRSRYVVSSRPAPRLVLENHGCVGLVRTHRLDQDDGPVASAHDREITRSLAHPPTKQPDQDGRRSAKATLAASRQRQIGNTRRLRNSPSAKW